MTLEIAATEFVDAASTRVATANAIFSVALTFACWLSKHTYRAYARREQTARPSRSEIAR
jgi:hypothetical protein